MKPCSVSEGPRRQEMRQATPIAIPPTAPAIAPKRDAHRAGGVDRPGEDRDEHRAIERDRDRVVEERFAFDDGAEQRRHAHAAEDCDHCDRVRGREDRAGKQTRSQRNPHHGERAGDRGAP